MVFFPGQIRVKLPQRQQEKLVYHKLFTSVTPELFLLYKRGHMLKEQDISLLLKTKICKLQVIIYIFLEVGHLKADVHKKRSHKMWVSYWQVKAEISFQRRKQFYKLL